MAVGVLTVAGVPLAAEASFTDSLKLGVLLTGVGVAVAEAIEILGLGVGIDKVNGFFTEGAGFSGSGFLNLTNGFSLNFSVFLNCKSP